MRPLGVLLICILLLFNAIITIFSGLLMVLFKEELYQMFQKEFEALSKGYEIPLELLKETYDIVLVLVLLIGVLFLVNAIGLFALKNWARVLAIALFGFQILYSALILPYDPLAVINIAIGALVIWYLLRKEVKEKFSRKSLSIEERILGQKS
ncbi:MAG: hypothetical protein QXQ38_02725 [Archaeoglobaceae archaeon]|nr:hypothetical protein [Archaeoglobales archaeon]MDI9643244.1 hypothetical protein [Archaeoglobales archaeon]